MSSASGDESDSSSGGACQGDSDGIWSADIEQSFLEALAIYPPCGRRKIILSEEGKMYGRNELIARYIKLRTGKTRTRKQVSSHIQVLARRRSKEMQAQVKDQTSKERMLQSLSSMSSSQIVSATTLQDTTNIDPCIYHKNNNNNRFYYTNNNSRHYANNNTNIIINPVNNDSSNNTTAITNNDNNNKNNNNSNSSTNKSSFYEVVTNCFDDEATTHELTLPRHKQNENWVPYNKHNYNYNNIDISKYDNKIYHNIENNVKNLNNISFGGNENDNINSTNKKVNDNHFLKYLKTNLMDFKVLSFEAFVEKADKTKHEILKLDKSVCNLSSNWPPIESRDLRDKLPEELFTLLKQHKPCFLVKSYVNAEVELNKEESVFFGINCVYECEHKVPLNDSTKVCSFGKEVIEKVEINQGESNSLKNLKNSSKNEECFDIQKPSQNSESPFKASAIASSPQINIDLNPQFSPMKFSKNLQKSLNVYKFSNLGSPMCEYMVSFIKKLLELDDNEMKASVLENLTVLKVIKNNNTNEVLIVLAFFFEISSSYKDKKCEIFQIVR